MKRLILISLACLVAACSGPETESPAEPAGTARAERKVFYPGEFAPGKSYSPGVQVGQTLYIAGQVSLDPQTREQPESVEDQTHTAMKNIGHVLRAAGLTYSNLVSCHVQLDDMENYAAMNAVYGSYYEEGHYPARTTLEMPSLVAGAHLEISCIAYADASAIRVIRPDPEVIPPAMGPYSSAVLAGDTLYLSGQGGRDPKTGEVAEAAEAQAAQTFSTIGHILDAAGLGFDDVVFANLYYLGEGNGAPVESAFRAKFPASAPNVGMLQLSRLPGTISVEITFIASAVDGGGATRYLPAEAAPDAGEGLEAQFRAVMERHRAHLSEAGLTFADVANANVYLADTGEFAAMDALFKEYFPENPPARTTVGVKEEGSRSGVRVEVSLIAAP